MATPLSGTDPPEYRYGLHTILGDDQQRRCPMSQVGVREPVYATQAECVRALREEKGREVSGG